VLRQRVPAIVVLAGVATAVALIVFSSLRYRGIFRLSGASLVLVLTLAMLLGYAACGVWALRRTVPAFRTGLIWGLAGGGIGALAIASSRGGQAGRSLVVRRR
jgi:hypothetical protein